MEYNGPDSGEWTIQFYTCYSKLLVTNRNWCISWTFSSIRERTSFSFLCNFRCTRWINWDQERFFYFICEFSSVKCIGKCQWMKKKKTDWNLPVIVAFPQNHRENPCNWCPKFEIAMLPDFVYSFWSSFLKLSTMHINDQ